MRQSLRKSALTLTLGACVVALFGCPSETVDPEPDAGTARPDACNSLEEALSDPQCALTLGEKRQAYLSFSGDQDWYSFTTPADANARTLLHLTGGYPVPNTAVNLSLNLLREDGKESLARESDRHGQSAPKPVDLTLPFSEPNQKLVVLVADDPTNPAKPNFDVRAQYEVTADVVQDPDPNEPNDATATPIALADQGGILTGTQSGFLSTQNDVDRFSFDVSGAKKVIYLHLTGPELSPPPPFRLKYTLSNSSGPIAEGVMQNEFLPVDLATARLARADTYTLEVKGYLGNDVSEVPGDLRMKYAIEVRVLDETDPSEGPNQNDSFASATVVSFGSPGQTQSTTARLGYAGDVDWFRFDVPARSEPTVLYYHLRPGSGPARFPPLPGALDRKLRVVEVVSTGGSAQNDKVTCKTDQNVCPSSYGNDPYLAGLTGELCDQTPSKCLWSMRVEHPEFESLRNFEGAIPIRPHASTLAVYVAMEDDGNDWADDVDYTLDLEWRADVDEAGRFSGGQEQTLITNLTGDPAAASFPVPSPGAQTVLQGKLSYGYGFFRDHDPNNGQGVRGPADYDAVSSDSDRYELTLPMLDDSDGGHLDRTWELQWEVAHQPGAPMPYDLAVSVEFCDGDRIDGGTCTPVSKGSKGTPMVLSYTDDERNSWHNPDGPAEQRQQLYDRTESSTATTTTARAYGCFCFEPRFMRGGKFVLTVVGVDRNSYADEPYTIRTAYTDYPKSYPLNGGGTESCPAPGADAGCWFTREP